MPTIHDDIESWLAAAVHGELSADERAAFAQHLATCADCRALHQEEIIMNNAIINTLQETRPDPAFENRVLAGFREKVPARPGALSFLLRMMQLRATQFAAVAAVLLTLVQVGKVVTHEPAPTGFRSVSRSEAKERLLESDRGQFASATNSLSLEGDNAFRGVTTVSGGLVATPSEIALGNGSSKLASDAGASHDFSVAQFDQKSAASRDGQTFEFDAGQKSLAHDAVADSDKAGGRQGSGAGGFADELSKAKPQKAERDLEQWAKDSTSLQAKQKPLSAASTLSVTAQSLSVPEQPRQAEPQNQKLAQNEPANVMQQPVTSPVADNRKLIRNAALEFVVASYDAALQQITGIATEEHGFIATNNSAKLANGKLQGTIVVKLQPENLDRFLLKLRALGELKNQTLGVDDVTKSYFDTEARLRNSKRMEDRLVEMLQKNTGKVSDLLQVEKELGRVREQIETMQGELKYLDAQVSHATVTIALAEKDLNQPAAFLLKEHANLSVIASDVEKAFSEAKHEADTAKAQILQSKLDRDSSGQVSGRLSLLIAPDDADAVIARVKGIGRVQNFTLENERVAQGGSGNSDTAKVERDKVELNVVISHDEQTRRQASLAVVTKSVEPTLDEAKAATIKNGGEVVGSDLARNSQGAATAHVTARVPAKNYEALLAAFKAYGRTSNFSVQRDDRAAAENGPVLLSLSLTDEERPVQTTSLRIETATVDEQVNSLKATAAKESAEVRSSTFSREPDGREVANVTLRVPMKNYGALIDSLGQLGKVRDLTVRRQDRAGQTNPEETAPAEVSVQVYSRGQIVADESGLFATIRRTLGEAFGAVMWSVRMIGVALAFLAPWAAAVGLAGWLVTRVVRARRKNG